jgi:large subunit ribosomal protein L29
MKAKEMRAQLREQSLDELRKRLSDLEEQLFKLRFQKSTGQIEDPTRISQARRNIARLLTVINERRAPGGV